MINRTVSQSGTSERKTKLLTFQISESLFRLLVTVSRAPRPELRKLTVHDKFDFGVRVARRVTGGVDGAEVHAVVPPHHLVDDEVSLCSQTT